MVGKSRDTNTYSKTTLACGALLLGAVIAYLYFLNMSVVQVVMRTEMVQNQHDLQAEIAVLESKYIDAQHVVAAKIATLEGYETDAKKLFVSRGQSRLVMGNN